MSWNIGPGIRINVPMINYTSIQTSRLLRGESACSGANAVISDFWPLDCILQFSLHFSCKLTFSHQRAIPVRIRRNPQKVQYKVCFYLGLGVICWIPLCCLDNSRAIPYGPKRFFREATTLSFHAEGNSFHSVIVPIWLRLFGIYYFRLTDLTSCSHSSLISSELLNKWLF